MRAVDDQHHRLAGIVRLEAGDARGLGVFLRLSSRTRPSLFWLFPREQHADRCREVRREREGVPAQARGLRLERILEGNHAAALVETRRGSDPVINPGDAVGAQEVRVRIAAHGHQRRAEALLRHAFAHVGTAQCDLVRGNKIVKPGIILRIGKRLVSEREIAAGRGDAHRLRPGVEMVVADDFEHATQREVVIAPGIAVAGVALELRARGLQRIEVNIQRVERLFLLLAHRGFEFFLDGGQRARVPDGDRGDLLAPGERERRCEYQRRPPGSAGDAHENRSGIFHGGDGAFSNPGNPARMRAEKSGASSAAMAALSMSERRFNSSNGRFPAANAPRS